MVRPLTWLFLLVISLPIQLTFAQEVIFSSVPGQDQLLVQKNVMIPAPDGVRLATDIYFPAENGKPVQEGLAVLLQRTPYGKTSERFQEAIRLFAARGYIVAIQDLRGRYDSEGIFTKYNPLEASDGAATVEWLSKLPAGNGKVAMWGTSYGAHTQADASKLDPKGLSAMVLNMGGMTNAWDHAVRQGGAFELGRELTWAFRQIPAEIDDPVVEAHFKKETIEDWYAAWPFRRGLNPLSIAPNFEDYILEELTHADYDDYWKATGINWIEYYDQTADVPMVHIGGWYDIFLRGTIQNFMELRKRQTAPKFLIIGPWTHSGNERTYAGDVDFGPESAISDFQTSYQVDWFDYFFKDKKADRLPKAPVQLFVMGTGDGSKNEAGRLNHGGYWLETDTWPLENALETTYYFHAEGSLNGTPPAAENAHTTYTFDPANPVPTLGGSVSARVKDGAFNQRERPDFAGSKPPYLPLKSRADVVVFQTDPLPEDMQVIGPINIKLYCSSTGVDTDFTVKLVDVYPPSEHFPEGFEMNLTDGIARMSYRNGRTTRDLIEPNEIYEVDIHPFPTANVFKKGHRIRVDISSSNFPRWDVNPNTGEPLGQNRRMLKVDNTIYHSPQFPSHITLPLVPMR
ncbi:CocE/NonD family hydrolase [Flavilitoribacter nigricans]|uniref:Antibiotic hydrolase n=1 Tax=Flavilitoribacter nigricans (strain ATCC 23147 / DSM 23189 / NBRC 102662 / NCIMB 1420 / SS-2) TaxID=1122177 RepID=A0A2D0N2N1_FLAN2|nr:CocE/NonD family hydrolase [Flavilitoribacter nigricans]PHN02389.1 antibiotic hydrolase [Flavilitoribacter nigricans DSM 23189 = NBRC 102662]